MLGFLLSILACEPMANPGNPFSDEPALSTIDSTATANNEVVAAVEVSSSKDSVNEPPKADGDFADPQDSEPVYSSAEAAKESTAAPPEEKSTNNFGEDNVLADLLSRGKFAQFRALAPDSLTHGVDVRSVDIISDLRDLIQRMLILSTGEY